MQWNVLASWVGHGVFIVAGFVMPRLIDQSLGQSQLGLWDFGWTIVSYLGLAGTGIGSSVSRYVARYRAIGDVESLSAAVSSVALVQFASATLVVVGTGILSAALPFLFGARLGADVGTARVVVVFLGLGLAVQMAFDYYRGVITGCHRWDVHNAVNAGAYAVAVVVMVIALKLGGGLGSLAFITFCGYSLGECVRAHLAHRVCPELVVRRRAASWAKIREMTYFGAKSLVNSLARLFLLQANSLLVAGSLGVSVLALYSRPMALLRHVETLTGKFAFVLSPTAAALRSAGAEGELRSLLVKGTRVSALIASPLLVTLGIMSDPILAVWMGQGYEAGSVVPVLCVGYYFAITQQSNLQILTGVNVHGRAAVASLGSALCGIALGVYLVQWCGWGLQGAATALSTSLAVGNGLFVLWLSCRRLHLEPAAYLREAYLQPLGLSVPLACALGLARWWFASRPATALLWGGAIGGAITLALYLRFVVPSLRGMVSRTPAETSASV